MLRIAFVGQKGYPAVWGGVEFHVGELAARLARRGHHVVVFTRPWYQRQAQEAGKVKIGQVQAVSLPTVPTKHFDALLHSILCALYARNRFDILHFHGIGPGSAAFLPRVRAPGTRCVLTVHALDWKREKWAPWARRTIRVLEACAVRSAHLVIAVSQVLRQYLRDQYGVRAAFVPNGVAPVRYRASQQVLREWGLHPGRYLLWVGRMVPEKGLKELLAAFRHVKGEGKLLLVGPSHDRAYSSVVRLEAAKDHRVVLAGLLTKDALEELWSNAGAFVLPSLLEGRPLALLEAIAYGLPVVVSDLPSVREILRETGPEAIVVRPGDVLSLRMALCRVVERFPRQPAPPPGVLLPSWDEVARRIEALYRQEVRREDRAAPKAV